MRYNFKVNIDANYTAQKWDDLIEVDCETSNVTLTLPAVDGVDVQNGHSIVIKRNDLGENLNELTVNGNGENIYQDDLGQNFKVLDGQIIRLVYWDGLWVVEFSNIQLEVWFDEIQQRSGGSLFTGLQQNYVSFPQDFSLYVVDKVFVSVFATGGRGDMGFEIQIGGSPILTDVLTTGLLCDTYDLDALLRDCDTFQINITSIPSPAPLGLRTAYRAVSYK